MENFGAVTNPKNSATSSYDRDMVVKGS